MEIRVRGWINAEGKWAVYGWDGATDDDAESVLQDMMTDSDMGRPFWLVAEIEVPKAIEIEATVENALPGCPHGTPDESGWCAQCEAGLPGPAKDHASPGSDT